jgi:hypothetical protein
VFEDLLLEEEQQRLLMVLVESSRNVKREARQEFLFSEHLNGADLFHPGLPHGKISAYKGDIEALIQGRFLSASYEPHGIILFNVTPRGFKYYEHLKGQIQEPLARLEANVKSYFDGNTFRQKYPLAYQKWSQAEELLWRSNTEHNLTTIGHLCREAIQEFATVLVDRYQPSDVEQEKARTVARIKAVLNLQHDKLGKTAKPFLDALLAYWGTVSDLIQRQEHGGQREASPLVWQDGRRIVFQTAVLMLEIDASLSSIPE